MAITGILFSWNIEHRAKEFFAFYLALIGGVYGVFLSFDLFLLLVFYEIAIIPKYFLIAIWGSTRREYAAMKLALYSFVGSAMVLIGLIAAYVVAGAKTMNLVDLAQFPFPAAFSNVGVSISVCRIWNLGRLMAIPHLGSHGPCRRTNRGVNAARRRGDEAGRIWLFASSYDAVSTRAGCRGDFMCSALVHGAKYSPC